jgi:hypothetical protein
MTTLVESTRRATRPESDRAGAMRQLASRAKLLAWCYGAVLVALLAVIGIRIVWGIPTEHLLRDMANLTGAPPYYGLVSSLGILMWGAAATLCLFAAAGLPARSGTRAFWIYAGILSLALTADDLFLLHEILFPSYLGVPEPAVYVLYGALAAGFLVLFRRTILRTEFVLLALALGWFALSLVVDRWGHLFLARGFWLVEDGFKLLGIVSWLLYFARTAYRDVRAPAAGGAGHGG